MANKTSMEQASRNLEERSTLMSEKHYSNITIEAVRKYCSGTVSDFTEESLLDILNGEVDLDEAREDVLSLMEDN